MGVGVGGHVPGLGSAVLIGPLRILSESVLGNRAVVQYRHLPTKLRREKWELWVGLPTAAYLASVLVGFATSLLTGGYTAALIGLAFLSFGFAYVRFLGIFFGMQDRSSDGELSQITDPGALHAELRDLRRRGTPAAHIVREAREQLRHLDFEPDSDRLAETRSDLLGRYALDASCAPNHGFGKWKDGDSTVIRLRRFTVTAAWIRYPTLWISVIVGLLLPIVLLALIYWQAGGLRGDWWVRPLWLLMAVFPVALSVVLSGVAARAALIYSLRLGMAERDHAERARRIIEEWEEGLALPMVGPPSALRRFADIFSLTTRIPKGVYDRLRLAVVLQDASIQEVVTAALDAHLPSTEVLRDARERGRSSRLDPTPDRGSEPGASVTDQTDLAGRTTRPAAGGQTDPAH